jgi:ribosome-associated protein
MECENMILVESSKKFMTDAKNTDESTDSNAYDDSCEQALACARAAIDKKAENVKILNLTEISGFTDYFVICSGTSDRQVQAIADSVQSELKAAGRKALSVEGYGEGRWVLLDFGDIVVHIFLDALRDYYDLENLWEDAPRIKIPSEFYLQSGDGKSHLS